MSILIFSTWDVPYPSWKGVGRLCQGVCECLCPTRGDSRCLEWFIMSRDVKPVTSHRKYDQSYFPNLSFTSSDECLLYMNVDARDTI